MSDSATNTFLPLVNVADILHTQTPEYGGTCRTLVISGLERDVYVRMARNVAGEFGFHQPGALYIRMVKNLSTYEDPRTHALIDVMTGSVPNGAIFYDEDESTIRRKIMRAYTGGRATVEEQRSLGGNPDPRVCSVSSLLAFHGVPDPSEYEQIKSSCRTGALLCGDCKANAVQRISAYVAEQQQKHRELSPLIVGTSHALAGTTPEQTADE